MKDRPAGMIAQIPLRKKLPRGIHKGSDASEFKKAVELFNNTAEITEG
jgi:hypothetical protein